MRRKTCDGPRGSVEIIEVESPLLRDNPWGDPATRQVAVYLPPGYRGSSESRYPALYALAGFTGSGLGMIGWRNFSENLPERLDRLIGVEGMPPVIVVCPDLFTTLGGNQYIDSSAVGAYGSHLVRELVPAIDGRFRTIPQRERRAIFGKSSGGYGALVHGMLHADCWGAVACHSGDMYFEYAYRCDFPRLVDVLARHDHSVERFLTDFYAKPKRSSDEMHALMTIAMAATYDPDPGAPLGFHLPVDARTGEIDAVRWQRWLRWDPIELVAEHASSLKSLALLYYDCGTRDQYHLHHGARILHDRLRAAGVEHVYEEFDDDHSGVDYRLDVSVPLLARALWMES